jgi:hypothetical protein
MYADQLAAAIKKAGCTLRRPRFLIDEHNGSGLWVTLHSADNIPPGADALIAALKGANVESVKSTTSEAIEPGVIYLFVELP